MNFCSKIKIFYLFIKSGDVAFGNVQNVQKSTSWMTTSTNFKVREPRTRAINKEISSQESATTSPDLMPPSSDGLQSQDDCPTKKSLFTSPKACAIKSLKRLSSECMIIIIMFLILTLSI